MFVKISRVCIIAMLSSNSFPCLSLHAQTVPNPIVIKSGDLSIEVTKNDIDVMEAYNGATWANDSGNVYFSKYVKISISKESRKRVDNYNMNKMMVEMQKSPPKNQADAAALEQKLATLPKEYDFDQPLYEKLLIFEYNINNKTMRLIAQNDFHSCGYPIHFFFAYEIVNNTLQYQDCRGVTALDLTTGQTNLTERRNGIVGGSKNRVSANDTYPGAVRFLSPDRHSFIQFTGSHGKDFFRTSPIPQLDAIGIFSDQAVKLATLEELGWKGGVEPMSMDITLNQYRPQYYIDPKLMQSPEEQNIRQRLGL